MSTGVLRWEDMRKAINLNTGFFETSQYDLDAQMRVIAGNWDGAGMSAGNLQYNFGPADRLSEFFNHLLSNHESVVRGVFGDKTDLFEQFKTVNLTYSRADKIKWGDGITDYTKPSPDGHALKQPWKDILGNLMITPQAYAKYFEMMDAYYVPDALDLFKQLNCYSRASLASLFDLNVNRGRFYPCNTLVVDFEQIEANTALSDEEKEAKKNYMINIRGNDTTNAMGASAPSFEPRRMAQANLGGDYYNSPYNPETDFDINLEPAIPEKAQGGFSVKLGEMNVHNVFLGNNPIKSIYLGANLLGNAEIKPYYTSKVPETQFRTLPNSYIGFKDGSITIEAGQELWVDVQNFVACKTYFTTDGSTPTVNSPVYHTSLKFTKSCVLKTLTVSLSGIAENVRTLNITVPVKGWRYLKVTPDTAKGHWQAYEIEIRDKAGVNRFVNATGSFAPLPDWTNTFGDIAQLKDGNKTESAVYWTWGYPLVLTIDLGASYELAEMDIWIGASTTNKTQAVNVQVSNDNVNWESGKVAFGGNIETLLQRYTFTS